MKKTTFSSNRCPIERLYIDKKKYLICSLAEINLIYKNTANTSSFTCRGCVTIFDPKTGLYVSLIPKP